MHQNTAPEQAAGGIHSFPNLHEALCNANARALSLYKRRSRVVGTMHCQHLGGIQDMDGFEWCTSALVVDIEILLYLTLPLLYPGLYQSTGLPI